MTDTGAASAKSEISICFATMCKNEEHCIRATLEAALPYVDSFLVYDTGSDDRTLDVVHAFFDEHPEIRGFSIGEVWEGYAISKTKMMAAATWKASPDYILHLDADDIVIAFDPAEIDRAADLHYATLERGGMSWQATILYRAKLVWKFCGVAHTTIRAPQKPELVYGTLASCRVSAEERGSRVFDPNKYQRDAELLVQQFEDTAVSDPDALHARSAFYAAQSFFDARAFDSALEWYGTFLKIGAWDEEIFEAHLRRARCNMARGAGIETIRPEIDAAIAREPERAEPHVFFGTWCNQNGYHEEAYRALREASGKSLSLVQRRYLLFVNPGAYDKHIVGELAVACYWSGRYREGVALLRGVIDDPDLAGARSNLAYNLEQFEIVMARTGSEVRGVTRGTPRIIVVDDFYEHPDNMRAIALDMPFVASPELHKGRRTLEAHRPDHVRVELERLLNRTISKWDYGANGVFQICKAGDPLVYHTDDQQYAAVVYLTPSAPLAAGTDFFRCKKTGARASRDRPPPSFERGFYDSSQFEIVDKIGNVYNRCVIWDASLIHAAGSYFGSTDLNARLFQIFFFDLSA